MSMRSFYSLRKFFPLREIYIFRDLLNKFIILLFGFADDIFHIATNRRPSRQFNLPVASGRS